LLHKAFREELYCSPFYKGKIFNVAHEGTRCLFLESCEVCKYTVMVKSEILLLQQVVCSLLLVLGTGLPNAQMNKISKVIKSKAVHVHSR
jgi:hypothetical protein